MTSTVETVYPDQLLDYYPLLWLRDELPLKLQDLLWDRRFMQSLRCHVPPLPMPFLEGVTLPDLIQGSLGLEADQVFLERDIYMSFSAPMALPIVGKGLVWFDITRPKLFGFAAFLLNPESEASLVIYNLTGLACLPAQAITALVRFLASEVRLQLSFALMYDGTGKSRILRSDLLEVPRTSRRRSVQVIYGG